MNTTDLQAAVNGVREALQRLDDGLVRANGTLPVLITAEGLVALHRTTKGLQKLTSTIGRFRVDGDADGETPGTDQGGTNQRPRRPRR